MGTDFIGKISSMLTTISNSLHVVQSKENGNQTKGLNKNKVLESELETNRDQEGYKYNQMNL